MKKIGLLSAALSFFASAAHAVCPLCMATVAVGLESARRMGVDYPILGIWAGAFLLLAFFLAMKIMKKMKVKNMAWYIAPVFLPISLVFIAYWIPGGVDFGAYTWFGVDTFLFGIITGAITMYFVQKWNYKKIRGNGGKSLFKFQKVIIPVGSLLLLSLIYAGIIYL